ARGHGQPRLPEHHPEPGRPRRANPDVSHLYTIAPIGKNGAWRVVVDVGGIVREERHLIRGRLPIGSLPPSSLPANLIAQGQRATTADILDLQSPSRARATALSPIAGPDGKAVGLAVVELSAAGLTERGGRLWAGCVAVV